MAVRGHAILRARYSGRSDPFSRWNMWVKLATPSTGTITFSTGTLSGIAINIPASQTRPIRRLRSRFASAMPIRRAPTSSKYCRPSR